MTAKSPRPQSVVGVVRLAHADLRIRPLAGLARHHEREDAREVGLVGHGQQVEHQPRMFLERLGDAERRVDGDDALGVRCLRSLDAALDFADVVEIVAQPDAIGRTDAALDELGGKLLVPGMPVEAFLATEQQTPFTYVTKPLVDYFNLAYRDTE